MSGQMDLGQEPARTLATGEVVRRLGVPMKERNRKF